MKTLGVFARYPEPGRTKTRLAADIGDQSAADLYACFLQDLIPRTGRLADEHWIAVTPETEQALAWFEALRLKAGLEQSRLQIQPDGDLGDRMTWFFREALRQHEGSAVLIGTDSPDLPSSRIAQAFELLSDDAADVVIAPATDGGYVLIGLNADPGTLFERVRWSSSRTLLDTLDAAESAGRRTVLLPAWYDVDHVENLGTLAALQRQQRQPGQTDAAACPQTVRCLQQVWSEKTDG